MPVPDLDIRKSGRAPDMVHFGDRVQYGFLIFIFTGGHNHGDRVGIREGIRNLVHCFTALRVDYLGDRGVGKRVFRQPGKIDRKRQEDQKDPDKTVF